MSQTPLNAYGDRKIDAGAGHGIDVATQRADDLDEECLRFIAACADPRQVRALDLGCGQAGQSLRMARLGADVTALDLVYQFDAAIEAARREGLSLRCGVIDLRLAHLVVDRPVDVIVCQRAIHYLPAADAAEAAAAMRALLAPGGRLYISASGMASELGNAYAGAHEPYERRLHPLSQQMADKHNIHAPVCLYTEQDLRALLVDAGFAVERLYSSPFGNVKAVATPG